MVKPEYGHMHKKARLAMLETETECRHCGKDLGWDGKPAVADHTPPLALHAHVAGTGCCDIIPSCASCSVAQGAAVAKLVSKVGATEITFDEPAPSPGPGDPVWDAMPWIEPLREVPENATWPRWMTFPHPAAIGSYGDDFIRYCLTQWGIELRWFQQLAAMRLFEHDVRGRLVWRRAFWSLGRQLGKSWLMKFLVLHFAENMTRYCPSASVDTTVMLCSRRLIAAEAVVESTIRWVLDHGQADGWDCGRSKGQKFVRLPNGFEIKPRSLDATFGSTNGLIVGDEIWSVDADEWNDGAAMTVAAVAGVQWFTSTANARATSFALNLRSDAFEELDDPNRLLFMEWSCDRAAGRDDRQAWRDASPHWDEDREELIADWLRSADRGITIDPNEPEPHQAFDANALNRWPIRQARRGRGEDLVDGKDWANALVTSGIPVSNRVLAVEDDYGRNLAVVIAGVTQTGRIGIEARSFDSKTEGWEFVKAARDIDQYLVGGSLMSEPAVRDIAPVEAVGTTHTRRGMSVLRSLLESGELTHTGDPDLAEQMIGCRVRPGASGLVIASGGRHSLVNAAAWSVDEAHHRRGQTVAVY